MSRITWLAVAMSFVAFALPAQTEQDEIVPGEDRVHDLRNDGAFVADDSREQFGALSEQAETIGAHLFLDRARSISGPAEFA
jgi:hypothetical protein